MKKKFWGLLCLLVLSAPLFADMGKEELQKMYLDYFRSRNINAQVDSDGDIEFRYEGTRFNEMTFWIGIDEDDQQYFLIFITGIYSLDTAAEKRRAPLAAAVATRKADVAKIYLRDDGANITASAEAFLANPQDFRAVFPKLMRELDSVMYYFLNEMRG